MITALSCGVDTWRGARQLDREAPLLTVAVPWIWYLRRSGVGVKRAVDWFPGVPVVPPTIWCGSLHEQSSVDCLVPSRVSVVVVQVHLAGSSRRDRPLAIGHCCPFGCTPCACFGRLCPGLISRCVPS